MDIQNQRVAPSQNDYNLNKPDVFNHVDLFYKTDASSMLG